MEGRGEPGYGYACVLAVKSSQGISAGLMPTEARGNYLPEAP